MPGPIIGKFIVVPRGVHFWEYDGWDELLRDAHAGVHGMFVLDSEPTLTKTKDCAWWGTASVVRNGEGRYRGIPFLFLQTY